MAFDVGSDDDSSDYDAEGKPKKKEVKTKYQKMAERQNQDVLSSHYRKLVDEGAEDDDEDDGFLSVKRVLGDKELDETAEGINGKEIAGAKVVKIGDQEIVIDSKRAEKKLMSKAKVAKMMGKGQKLIFDEEGNAQPLYVLQGLEDFQKEGDAKELRQKFVEAEGERVKEADVEDKELARKRRKEKRDRAKARERGEEVERERGPITQLDSGDEMDEDPLALLRSLPIAGGGGEQSEEDEPPKKKTKKWFQNDSDVEDQPERKKKASSGKKVIEMGYEPDNLQDLEALAAGLLED